MVNLMSGRIIVYSRTAPTYILDHVTRIEWSGKLIVLHHQGGRVQLNPEDIFKFEGR